MVQMRPKNVLELTRLWIEDGTPKNTESFFISQCLKRACREIIVSFAQIDAGHVGTVYQATNWYYTGLSAKFKDPIHLGEFKGQHHTGWAYGMSNKKSGPSGATWWYSGRGPGNIATFL